MPLAKGAPSGCLASAAWLMALFAWSGCAGSTPPALTGGGGSGGNGSGGSGGADGPLGDSGADGVPAAEDGADGPSLSPDTGPADEPPPLTDADAGHDAGDDAARAQVPMFVAIGSRFRRIVSCDDGLTWVADQIDTSAADDESTGARGLGYGDGLFVAATGGGGRTARLFSTSDGIVWTERVPTGVYNGFSQVAHGNGFYVAGGGNVSIRSRTGIDGWGDLASMGDGGILRHLAFGGGTFVAVGGGRIQRSTDAAAWAGPMAGMCAGEVIDVVFGSGRFLAVNGDGVTCLSVDGGLNWTNGSVGGGGLRGLVWTGHDFLARAYDKTYRSADGVAWTSTATASAGPDLMAVSDQGTFVGVAGSAFYRSADGLAWTAVPVHSDDPTRGFNRLIFGRASRSGLCPGP